MINKITTHLWYDKEAREAAEFFVASFKEVFNSAGDKSEIKEISKLDNTPSGSVDIVTIDLLGQEFTLISAGPYFKFNPSVSFLVQCRTKDEVDTLWEKLSEGGSVLMELDKYPFSERYGWVQDRYGLSWQVFLTKEEIKQRIIPTLTFAGDVNGKAEEAINFYTSVFCDAKAGEIYRYGKDQKSDKEGAIAWASLTLEGVEFAVMDSARIHDAAFNEAVSFMVHCDTQEEIDYYWDKLSAVSEAEQCGWLKDKFGFSWQVVPDALHGMLRDSDKKKVARVTEAFLKMKKLDIGKLREAYEGKLAAAA